MCAPTILNPLTPPDKKKKTSPFCGKLLVDYGAHVLRIDQGPASIPDLLAHAKRSLSINLKSAAGLTLVKQLLLDADVLIDPFRPGTLERLGLGPDVLCRANKRLIYARLTGFRRDGKYAAMAGHDINYLAVSGALSLLGREGEPPSPPANILADFAGGGAVCFLGILLALLARTTRGEGQVVEANMVDGTACLTAFARFLQKTPTWSAPRGRNLLDGGAPFYAAYRTADGGFMAVGALEPKFYAAFVGLLFQDSGYGVVPDRTDRRTWPELKEMIERRFAEKTRAQWEGVFDGTDACVTPVLSNQELEKAQFEQRPIVTLKASQTVHSGGEGWTGRVLEPGEGGKEALEEWWGWKEGVRWRVGEKGFESIEEKAEVGSKL